MHSCVPNSVNVNTFWCDIKSFVFTFLLRPLEDESTTIKQKKFVTITYAHFCNTKLFVMRKNASRPKPNFMRDFPASVSAIQGKFVTLRKFVMQSLQVSDCDKLFSFHNHRPSCTFTAPTGAGLQLL